MTKYIIISASILATITGGVVTQNNINDSLQSEASEVIQASKEQVVLVDTQVEELEVEPVIVEIEVVDEDEESKEVSEEEVSAYINESAQRNAADVGRMKGEPSVHAANTNQSVKEYTNQYFPDFSLVYFSDWDFNENIVADQNNPDLVTREITLTKGETTLSVYTFGQFPTGCGYESPEYYVSPLRANINGSTIGRFDYSDGRGDFYSPRSDDMEYGCNLTTYFTINSNISDTELVRDYNNTYFTSEDTLNFWAYASVEGVENLDEADMIISQSTFK